MRRFYGKYRGKVENNIDPENRGRIQVSCEAVLGGGRSSWALPCAPFAGRGVGLFAVPPNGSRVWVEFEEGDSNKPIWSGGFWLLGEAPIMPALPFVKVFKTDALMLKLDDTPGTGGITLQISPPLAPVPIQIVCGPTGVSIQHGTAKIALEQFKVTINEGALEVT